MGGVKERLGHLKQDKGKRGKRVEKTTRRQEWRMKKGTGNDKKEDASANRGD